jgi:NADPH:quinone reductase-like Zn-dependent oxidoreductase
MRAVRLCARPELSMLVALERVEVPRLGLAEALVREDVSDLAIGDAGWALASFDRDGAAAEGRARACLVPGAEAPRARVRRERRHTAGGALTWQALFYDGRLRDGERVLIHGATGASATLHVRPRA